jgi:WD40 repeat protein
MGGTVALWDLDRGGSRVLGRLPSPVLSLLFSTDEESLYVGLWSGAVHAASFQRGATPGLEPLAGPIPGASPTTNRVLSLSADGRTLAFPRSGGVALLDTESRAEVLLPVPEGRVTSVALSPDRRRLAAGTSAKAAYVWDLGTGDRRLLSGFGGQGVQVAFSPDGALLAATGTSDVAARLYRVEPPSPVSADDLPTEPAALRAWIAQAGGPGVDGLLRREGR